nr:ClbS/DfsB family four-helix bundle protein [Mesoplasma chauliocola]
MKEYLNKEELIKEIFCKYEKYDLEFNSISESKRNTRTNKLEKTPTENLAYQIGWISLLLSWDEDERNGKEVKTPTPEYKWNNLGNLYNSFYEKYSFSSIKEQRDELKYLVYKLCDWICTLEDDELFCPNKRKWAKTNANWPL